MAATLSHFLGSQEGKTVGCANTKGRLSAAEGSLPLSASHEGFTSGGDVGGRSIAEGEVPERSLLVVPLSLRLSLPLLSLSLSLMGCMSWGGINAGGPLGEGEGLSFFIAEGVRALLPFYRETKDEIDSISHGTLQIRIGGESEYRWRK